MLCVSEQSRKDYDDTQVLNIDEKKYEDDADMMYMMYMLHMLTAAAADSEMRQDMKITVTTGMNEADVEKLSGLAILYL